MGESSSKRVVGQQFVGLHAPVSFLTSFPVHWEPKQGGDGRCLSPSPDTACYQEYGGALGQRLGADAGCDARRVSAGKAKGCTGNRRRLRQTTVPAGHGRCAACGPAEALPKTTRSDLL